MAVPLGGLRFCAAVVGGLGLFVGIHWREAIIPKEIYRILEILTAVKLDIVGAERLKKLLYICYGHCIHRRIQETKDQPPRNTA